MNVNIKDKIKVFLETAYETRVKIINSHDLTNLFPINNDNQGYFDIIITDSRIVNYFRKVVKGITDFKENPMPNSFEFNIGKIERNRTNYSSDDIYDKDYIVYAEVKLSSVISNEEKNYVFNKAGCKISLKENIPPNFLLNNLNAWPTIVVNDFSNVKFQNFIEFSLLDEEKCLICKVYYDKFSEMRYCENEEGFYCINCFDENHQKNISYKNHFITNESKYSISYFSKYCIHNDSSSLSSYQFFCFNCNTFLCSLCFNKDERHFNMNNHNVKNIEEADNILRKDYSLITKKIKEIPNEISEEISISVSLKKKINEIDKKISEDIEKLEKSKKEEIEKEYMSRVVYLSSIFFEMQRLLCEFESKTLFIKRQLETSDQISYIISTNMYEKYIKEELIPSMESVLTWDYSHISNELCEEINN